MNDLGLWFALIIPIICAIAALIFFRKKVTLWEPFIPMFGAALLILVFKWIGISSATSDNEYLSYHVVKVQYYEDWDYWQHQMCSMTVNCGKNCTRTVYYDCSHRVYCSAEWYAVLNNGQKVAISKTHYSTIIQKFKNNASFVDMNRDYYTKDGDMYETVWTDGDYNSFEFMAFEETYENRVQCSDDVFNYPDVSEEDVKEYKLFDYPEIDKFYKQPSVLADSTIVIPPCAQYKFDWLNGKLGMVKQVKIWVILMKNAERQRASMQEWYWKGGNKNELIYIISLDNKSCVEWCKVLSWTEREDLKVETRTWIEQNYKSKPLELLTFGDYLYKEVQKKFERKKWEDFNYITVDPPTWCYWVTWIFVLLSCIGLYYWIITNEFDNNIEK